MKTRALLATLVGAALATVAGYAIAQRVDARRPTTFVVGATPGASPTPRVDSQRSGVSKAAFPKAPLRLDWRKPVGSTLDQPPLVLDSSGDSTIALVSGRGEAVWYQSDGTESAKVFLGIGTAGAPIALADGTLVVTSGAGEVVGIRREGLRFKVSIGSDRSALLGSTPLALLDGGFVVAYGADLITFDAEGNVRSRATAPEAPTGPLASADGKIYFASSGGVLYSWNAARDVVRVGSFGGSLDGGFALDAGHTAYAVVDGSRLVALDLAKGVALPRATMTSGAYLGPPAIRNGSAAMMAIIPGRTFALVIDGNGQEALRVPLTSPTLALLSLGDAGAAFVVPSHTGVLYDAGGSIAFASPEGVVGVIDPTGAAQTLPDVPCPKGGRNGGISAIVPGGPGALVVACSSGTLVRIIGAN